MQKDEESISEMIKNFTEPCKQAIKNLKDNIMDTINDMAKGDFESRKSIFETDTTQKKLKSLIKNRLSKEELSCSDYGIIGINYTELFDYQTALEAKLLTGLPIEKNDYAIAKQNAHYLYDAITYFKKAYDLFDNTENGSAWDIDDIIWSIGNCYRKLGFFTLDIDATDNAIKCFKHLEDTYSKFESDYDEDLDDIKLELKNLYELKRTLS